MTAELHWLACYVMLSRATELDGLLISRLCTRAELGRGPPQFLLDELERLRGVEEASLRNLEAYIRRVWPAAPADLLCILSTLSDEYMWQDTSRTVQLPATPSAAASPTLSKVASGCEDREAPVVSSSRKHTSPGQHSAAAQRCSPGGVGTNPCRGRNHATPYCTILEKGCVRKLTVPTPRDTTAIGLHNYWQCTQLRDNPPVDAGALATEASRVGDAFLHKGCTRVQAGCWHWLCFLPSHLPQYVCSCFMSTWNLAESAPASTLSHMRIPQHVLHASRAEGVGCHRCGRSTCFSTEPSCHARCMPSRHVCSPSTPGGCSANCGRVCHADNTDLRCTFYERGRGHVTWATDEQQRRDTLAGTGGSVPHLSQLNWRFDSRNTCRRQEDTR